MRVDHLTGKRIEFYRVRIKRRVELKIKKAKV